MDKIPLKEDNITELNLYDPEIAGSRLLSPIIQIFVLILTGLFIYYLSQLLLNYTYTTILALFIDTILILIQILFGFYSLIYMLHFAYSFKSINQELDPVISIKDLKDINSLPFISILIPIFREPVKILRDTIISTKQLNYPSERLEVVVIEDGKLNDDVSDLCKEMNANHLTRKDRIGFKAGAVNYSLSKLRGDYVLFIDADHILDKNIILNCLIAWRKDTIAVQTRIDFVNINSYLNIVSAYLQVQFFSLFQRARRRTGSAIFAGGAALFLRQKLIEEGGLNPLTIADDTDTSIILRSKGHRIEYIDVIGAWALIPWDPLHLIRQIWRWLTGITRSFRARWKLIIKSKQPIYVKLDFLSLGIFPTVAVFSWLSGFLLIIAIQQNLITQIFYQSSNVFLNLLITLIWLSPILIGILVLFIDNEGLYYAKQSGIRKLNSIISFYLLLLAAQPLLIGAILKGLFGIKVSFNRTPKIKKAKENLLSLKRQYLSFSLVIFGVGMLFGYYGYIAGFNDPRSYSLVFTALLSIVPLLISIYWYWKIEGYLESFGDVSAMDLLIK